MSDNVNHPSHYADYCSIECKDAMELAFGKKEYYNFCLMNAFKYIWRHKFKNGKEDLKKAEWYLKEADRLLKDIKFSVEDFDKICKLNEMLKIAKYNMEIEEEL